MANAQLCSIRTARWNGLLRRPTCRTGFVVGLGFIGSLEPGECWPQYVLSHLHRIMGPFSFLFVVIGGCMVLMLV